MAFNKGQIVGDLYEIQEIFSGGMGIVYRARHLAWDINVAIKHPRSEFLKSRIQIDEFHAECATWARLGLDPFIATCFYSREIGGLPCVIAEFLPGGSLQDGIHRRGLYQGDEDECLSRVLTIAASSSWGLMGAHQARLLHCDIKPGNMLLTEYGTAKIADFGLAVAFRPSMPEVKAAGLTVAFASPEQFNGNPLTPAADVWSWAASMLAMFTGGATWENGAACGAALRQFLDEGGKAYRIPAMPSGFAELLGQCFRFSSEERISDFEQIAERVCGIYEEIMDVPCPAVRPDLVLISADSLNNRAVSRLDLGDQTEAHRFFDEALGGDPLHPEANYNAGLLEYRSRGKVSKVFLEHLAQDALLEPGEYRPWLYRACLLKLCGHSTEAAECLEHARRIASHSESHEIQCQWELTIKGNSTPILAPPISGEDFAYDSARFQRLMEKAETAVREKRMDDAKRYLLMSGDIPGFARHPHRRKLQDHFATTPNNISQ
jgi:serine/threonine protein kinase